MDAIKNHSKLVSALVLTVILSIGSIGVAAQETPLSLGEVMTALQSTSSGLTVAQKNEFIELRVNQRGVTFNLSAQLKRELQNAGANTSLISAIEANGPEANQTSTTKSTETTPAIKFNRLWTEVVERDGRPGLMVHVHYTAYNLKGIPLQMTIRFQDADKKMLKSGNRSYANKSGELALFRNFTPGFDAAVYKDWSVFVPFSELSVGAGSQTLNIDAAIIYPEGKLLQHMTMQPVTFNKPRPSLSAPRAVFDKMWVDYGVREYGKLGMRIHLKLRVHNLKDTKCQVKIMFEKEDGDRLTAANTFYSDRSGGVTLFSELNPGSVTSVYNDIAIFMPYDELNLGPGSYRLKMHADLTYPDESLITHLNYYPFSYRSGVTR